MEPEILTETEETLPEEELLPEPAAQPISMDTPEEVEDPAPEEVEDPAPEEVPAEEPEVVKPRPRRKRRSISPWLMGVVFLLGVACGYWLRGALPAHPEDATLTTQQTTEASTETTETIETTEETQIPTEPPIPYANLEDQPWNLALINSWNVLPEDFAVELVNLPNGLQVDSRCYEDLCRMLSDCREAGLHPVVCSAYRSVEGQEKLFRKKVDEFLARDMSREEAEAEAAIVVAVPGTSEHHLGLAVDIVDESYQLLDENQEQTPVQQWLMEHCWEYGFILRYPNGSSEITGIIYEPWHYRYVGVEAARQIHDLGMTLEEYMQWLEEPPAESTEPTEATE